MRDEVFVVVSFHGICYTDQGQPAIYRDAAPAELLAAQLRERQKDVSYTVVACPVL